MKIFSTQKCELGESPLWHPQRGSLFWLDILQRKLYEKKINSSSEDFDQVWGLPEYASIISLDKRRQETLWMVTNKSFGHFDLIKGHFHKTLELNLPSTHRANDGGVSPAGEFYFGTMAWEPSAIDGQIFSVTSSAKLIDHQLKIGIPNTFCWDADGNGILITDSLQQKTFHFQLKQGELQKNSRTIFNDLSHTETTPDGGAMDADGMLWNVHWGGKKVVKYNHKGREQGAIMLPVPRPTSCCFGGQDNTILFITSASTGLSQKTKNEYPQSGAVMLLNLEVPGVELQPFGLDD